MRWQDMWGRVRQTCRPYSGMIFTYFSSSPLLVVSPGAGLMTGDESSRMQLSMARCAPSHAYKTLRDVKVDFQLTFTIRNWSKLRKNYDYEGFCHRWHDFDQHMQIILKIQVYFGIGTKRSRRD